MTDDRFREIQLSGKQLVFVFMATAVVAVVIFLTGVMVGRGVRADRGLVGDVEPPAAGAAGGAAVPGTAAASGAASAPPPADDELSYYSKLDGAAPTSKPGSEAPAGVANKPREGPSPDVIDRPVEEPQKAGTAAPPAESKPREPDPVPPPSTAATARPSDAVAAERPFAEPSGAGYALQVTALRERAAAEKVAKQLVAKGYAAYIVEPGGGSTAGVYRVRVGKFKTREEADEIKRRLEKDQYKPILSR